MWETNKRPRPAMREKTKRRLQETTIREHDGKLTTLCRPLLLAPRRSDVSVEDASTLGVLIANESGEDIRGAVISLPAGIGAAIGAAMPTGGFQKVYDARKTEKQP